MIHLCDQSSKILINRLPEATRTFKLKDRKEMFMAMLCYSFNDYLTEREREAEFDSIYSHGYITRINQF